MKLEHLNRSTSLVPLSGDGRAVQEAAGKGCTAAAPTSPASSPQPSPSSSMGSCLGQLKAARARVSWRKQ